MSSCLLFRPFVLAKNKSSFTTSICLSHIFRECKADISTFQTKYLKAVIQQRGPDTSKVLRIVPELPLRSCVRNSSSRSGDQQRSNKDRQNIFASPYAKIPVCTTAIHEKVLSGVQRTINKTQGRAAFISAEDPRIQITFENVYDQAHRVASFLSQKGYGHQDVCCQVLPNSYHFVVFYLGALLTGGVMSAAGAQSTEYELKRQFFDSDCKVVITNYVNLNKVLFAVKECPRVQYVICVRPSGSSDTLPPEVVSWEEVISTPITPLPKYVYNPEDTALLPYSSGTTGIQKGVMLSHKNFSTMMDIWDKHCVDHFIPKIGDGNWDYHKENFLLFLPFHHIFGFGSMNHILSNGATGIVFSKFDPTVFLEAIQTYKMHDFGVVQLRVRCERFGVHFAYNGLGKKFAYYSYRNGVKGTHFPPLDSRDEFSNVGMLVSTLEQKIASETGEALPIREVGEVCIRGPTIMKGYLGCPDATAQTIDSEGWLHTGDIGFLDEKGQLHIVDRLKELIKVKGLQVAPSELEDILLSHEDISDAAVIGVPDGKHGEIPRAYVVRTNESFMEVVVQRFIHGKVTSHKHLTGGVAFVSVIPKSSSGKILRRILRDQFQKEMSSEPH
ncbi:hypothetical protein KIN20_016642 [Parelaphostrongylus tenuis]|uniref:Uncharacterized protein n=1 Tax=Parelaphostrongylus tenuis TaxID=148309 RepID=A0AAD5QQX6_PARTN|nr:hypothetical protein KIN20_016642 [Parelaphostrongylus tenuis]